MQVQVRRHGLQRTAGLGWKPCSGGLSHIAKGLVNYAGKYKVHLKANEAIEQTEKTSRKSHHAKCKFTLAVVGQAEVS